MRVVAVAIIYILVVILLFIISNIKEGFKGSTVEIVIANYEEDLKWVDEIPVSLYDKLTIYNKGKPKDYSGLVEKGAVIHNLANVGREAHTYLYHVIINYNNLPEVILFLPGSTMTFDQKKTQYDIILKELETTKESVIVGFKDPEYLQKELDTFVLDEYEITSEENKRDHPGTKLEPASIRPFGNWVKARFPGKSLTCMSYRGVLAVSRKDIYKKPLEYYKKLLEELQFKNSEVVHYFERAWPLVFSISDENCKTAVYNLNSK
jgi:hypothetical protein